MRHHFYQTINGWFDFEDIYRAMVECANDKAHFVEVGAFEGKSTAFMAVEILNSKKAIRFDVVDTWKGSPEHQTGGNWQSQSVVDEKLFETFKENMRPVAHLIYPIRRSSVEASTLYSNASLDFVFIDASHDYESVKADILAWRPKVKPGGYLAGHDYLGDFSGVRKAVDELVSLHEVRGTSWLVRV